MGRRGADDVLEGLRELDMRTVVGPEDAFPHQKIERDVDKRSFEPRISCPNDRCKDGGFDLGARLLETAIQGRRNHARGTIPCKGHVKRRAGGRTSCDHVLEYEAEITYARG
jgi:hypothetical protein